MMKEMRYIFREICSCNMCGQETARNKVLGQRMNCSQGLRPRKKQGITTSVIKCSNCHLIYSNPQPVPVDIKDHYGVLPENYWREEYFELNSTYFSEEISKAKELLLFRKGMKALDIGAGIGKCMKSLKREGFDAYGLEPSPQFRDRAMDKMGVDPNKLKLGMLEEAEFPNEQFDFITFGAVLEHLYNPSKSIIKALRWLKPKGVMHMEVPSSDYLMAKIINFYYRAIGTNYVTNISPMHEPFHLFEFGYKSFEEHAMENRYEIVSHRYYVCNIYYMPSFFHPIFRWYMQKTNSGMQLSIWLQKC